MNRSNLLKVLEKKYKKGFFKKSEEYGYGKGMILTGETSQVVVDLDGEDFEMPMFDYYSEDYRETTYVMGVWKELHEYLESVGWFAECHDAGTYLICKA